MLGQGSVGKLCFKSVHQGQCLLQELLLCDGQIENLLVEELRGIAEPLTFSCGECEDLRTVRLGEIADIDDVPERGDV
ncbi:hypothetical protein SDC9_77766 [bioreactor metagenome]|uniref:Uncharacterized protein n=1 Tax=bioreactor metagenome TaxID=1076179 RepID=A0A644YRJ2_9ZZZZ